MIKIFYRDLSPGLHASAEAEGRNTVISFLPGLTPDQRRAALRRIRHSGRMGHGPRVPAGKLAIALALDRVTAAVRTGTAVVRLHPAGSALPVVFFSAAAVIFVLMATVSIHVLPAARGRLGQVPRGGRSDSRARLSAPAVSQGVTPPGGSRASRRGTVPGRLAARQLSPSGTTAVGSVGAGVRQPRAPDRRDRRRARPRAPDPRRLAPRPARPVLPGPPGRRVLRVRGTGSAGTGSGSSGASGGSGSGTSSGGRGSSGSGSAGSGGSGSGSSGSGSGHRHRIGFRVRRDSRFRRFRFRRFRFRQSRLRRSGFRRSRSGGSGSRRSGSRRSRIQAVPDREARVPAAARGRAAGPASTSCRSRCASACNRLSADAAPAVSSGRPLVSASGRPTSSSGSGRNPRGAMSRPRSRPGPRTRAATSGATAEGACR